MSSEEPLLIADNLAVTFRVGERRLHAVADVSLSVRPHETVGVVGESGSGKSTLALAIMRVHEPEAGRIRFEGQDITHLSQREMKPIRRKVQMIFQDPYASLDPRWTVEQIIAEPLRAHGIGDRAARRQRVLALMDQVGLPRSAAGRLASQFSGGQRQRIAIARALALEPDLIIADEPVSALDVSIQAQIVTLLEEIQQRTGVAYLIIAHDLALVHQITDRVVVLYLGQVVEEGPTDAVIGAPQHPYTAALLSAAPTPNLDAGTERIVLRGEPPSPMDPPGGCRFHTRCPIARPECAEKEPPLAEVAGRKVRCLFPGELAHTSPLARLSDNMIAGQIT